MFPSIVNDVIASYSWQAKLEQIDSKLPKSNDQNQVYVKRAGLGNILWLYESDNGEAYVSGYDIDKDELLTPYHIILETPDDIKLDCKGRLYISYTGYDDTQRFNVTEPHHHEGGCVYKDGSILWKGHKEPEYIRYIPPFVTDSYLSPDMLWEFDLHSRRGCIGFGLKSQPSPLITIPFWCDLLGRIGVRWLAWSPDCRSVVLTDEYSAPHKTWRITLTNAWLDLDRIE